MEANKSIEALIGEPLVKAWIHYYDCPELDDDIEKIVFVFGTKKLVVSAIGATDEVKVELLDKDDTDARGSTHSLLQQYIGKRLSCVWKCTHLDREDYFDMCAVGFEHLHPSLLVLCEASELLLFETKRLKHSASPSA